ncbi:MAG: hypothetical protein AABX34_04700 [Nanoarchaeota archaeon]
MALLKTNFVDIMHHLEKDKVKIMETLEALSLREGERYISLGIGTNLLPFIIAMQGVNVMGIDISPEALAFQMQNLGRFGSYLKQSQGSFAVYNLNFDDPYTGTKHIPGFPMLDYDKIKDSFDIVECVFFNHVEGEADLAQILLNLAKPSARFFVSAPGGQVKGTDLQWRDRTAHALIKETTLKSYRPQLEVVATDLYVSTLHSNHYGVVLRPNSHL